MRTKRVKNKHTGKTATILRVEDVPDGTDPTRRVVVYHWQGEHQEERWEEQDFWRHNEG